MAGCVIHPIATFRRDHPHSAILFRTTSQKVCTIGGYSWYLEDQGQKILIDTGGNIDYIRNVKKNTCDEVQTLEQGLHKYGVEPREIDLVIFTHLHHDHVGQARSIPNARFLAQKDEVDFALHPHPFYREAYPRQFLDGITLEAVEGDIKISDNISLIKTPGHTAGGQSVCIKTDKGLVIISGLCSIQENYEPSLVGSDLEVIPPTPHINVIQAYDSMVKVKRMADYVIPNHDIRYMKTDSIM